MKNRIVFKALSACLVLSLLYHDFAWALDVRQAIIDAKKSFEEMDEGRKRAGMRLPDLRRAQSSQQAEVENQNTLQDLETLNFSLTTPNGDIIRYLGNRIDSIERPDGSFLNNVTLDAAGNITGADLRLADGSIQIYRDGGVLGTRQPNGTQVFYQNGEVTKTLSSDGTETLYSYIKDFQGVITETILDNVRFEARYDANGALKRLYDKDDEKISEFENGILKLVSFPDGSSLTFKAQDLTNEIKVTPLYYVSAAAELYNYAGQVESPFEYAIYRQNRTPKAIKTPEGTVLQFDEEGLITSAMDAGGSAVAFDFTESVLSHIIQTKVTTPNLESVYNAEGRLASVKFGELTLHYKKDADTLEWIEKSDGTELWDLVFNQAGDLIGTTIYDPIGNISVYENGALKSYTSHENVHYDFFDGQITKVTTPEAFVYNFAYTPEAITAELDPNLVPDALTAVRMEYDSGMNLKKLVRQNREILSFFNNELVRIDLPNGAPQVYSYAKDANGKITKTTVTQGNVTTVYDAFGQPVSSTVSPDAENPHALDIAYQYGKIREIRKDGVLTLVYSYSFKADGAEVTQIDDLEENSKKIYEKGLLLTSFDTASSVLSSYSYSGGKVSRVELTRFGRVLHTYDYAYSGDHTIVTDEEGVIRTYSSDQKLLFLEREGARYAYSYTEQEPFVQTLEGNLGVDTLATSQRSRSITEHWSADLAELALMTADNNRYVDYKVTLPSSGRIQVSLKAKNFGALPPPSGYYYEIWVYVDGVKKTEMDISASSTQWRSDSVTLSSSLTPGEHSVRLKWVNETHTTTRDANLMFKDLKIVHLPTVGTQTTLPVATLQTYDRSRTIVDYWIENAGEGSLTSSAGGQYVEYNFTLAHNGSLKVDMDSIHGDPGPIPAGYTDYDIELFVDGQSFGIHKFGASTAWQPGSALLSGLTAGAHTLRLLWRNEVTGPAADTDFKFRNLELSNVYDITSPRQTIVREELVERTLGDGSLVRYDQGGIVSIDLPDGSSITDVVLDEAGRFSRGTVTLPSETKKVFGASGVLEEILMDGTRLYYDGGKLAKYVFPEGNEVTLDYSGGITKAGIGDFAFHYDAAGNLIGFTSSAGNYYASNGVNGSASPEAQIAEVLSQAIAAETSAFDANAAARAAAQTERARQEALRSRKAERSVGAGYSYTPPFEFAADFITSHGRYPGNTTGWRYEFSGQWLPTYSTEPHGVWFYTGPSLGAPRVFVTMNQLAGYEAIPYPNLYIPPSESFATIMGSKGAINSSFAASTFNFGSVWQKMPSELLWRTVSPNVQSHPFLTQNQWLYIAAHLGSIRTGTCDAGWGMSCTPGQEYMLISQATNSYGAASYNSNQAYYFGYVVEDEKIAAINSQLADLSAQAAAITGRREALSNRRAAVLGSPAYLETHVSIAKTPFAGVLNDATPAADKTRWFAATDEAILESGEVVLQEYSIDGILETQTHFDGTVTLFDNQNRPSQVLDKKGNLLIEYSYDVSGNLERVYLKNAREKLPEEVMRAKAGIEEGRQKNLLELAEAKSLAVSGIKAQADVARAQIMSQINYIQGEISNLEGLDVRGKQAKKAKSEALDQVRGVANSVWAQWSELLRVEADAYAGLDLQIKTLSDEIKSQANLAFSELDVQEKTLQKEILRQEISPLIYDRYRRVLGRDPSSAEYDAWLAKMDYETGEVIVHEETLVTIDPGASVKFDGADDYLTLPDSDDWFLGQADFTIELNVKFNAFTQAQRGFVEQSDGGANGWKFYYHNSAGLFFTLNGSTIIIQRPWSPVTGQWYHLALVRSGNTWRLFADGVQLGDAVTNSTAIPNFTQSLVVGAMHDGGIRYYLNGWEDGLRISTNARFTSNFTPPDYRQTPDAKTVLLLEVNRSNGAVSDTSASARPVTRLGGITTSTTQYKLSKRTETRIVQKAALTTALRDNLNALPELAERQTYVAAIKSQVANLLRGYLAKSDADKAVFAASLGLTSQDLIPLSSADAQKIIVWLDTRSLHFGQSAFLSLESLLDQKGIHYAREDIAIKAILVDVLTGVITPLDEGDLVISVYALDKVASLYGLSLSAANLSWEDLLAIYQNDPAARIIAHINGNHYVIITGVTADSITYIDPGIGKDKQNESVTVTKAGFLKAWKGNVTADAVALSAAKQRDGSQIKILSASEAKDIRGAFWGSILGLIGSILSWIPGLNAIGLILSAISAAISAIEGDWISAISSIVTLGLGSFGDFFKAAFQGVVQAMGPIGQAFMAVGAFAKDLYQGVVGFLNTAISFLPGIGHALLSAAAAQGMSIGAQIVNFALSTGISMGVSKGLEIIGVNPQLAAYAGSLASGFVIGGLSKTAANQSGVALSQSQQIRSVVMDQVLINNIGRLGAELRLDPMFTQLVGLSLGAIQGTIIQSPATSMEQFLKIVTPTITQSLSLFGVQKLGDSLGLDPKLSFAMGLPIAGAIGRSFDAGRIVGEDLIQSVLDGFSHGGLQLGLDFAIDELDIDNPLLEALASATITSTASSLLDPNGSLFEDLMKGAKEATLDFLKEIHTTDFAQLVQEHGIAGALETTATSVFSRQALEEIHSVGGIAQLISGRAKNIDLNGVTITEVAITSSEKFYLDSNGNLYAILKDGELKTGRFSRDSQNNVYFVEGVIEKTLPNGQKEIIQVQNGSSVHVTYSVEGQPIIEIKVNKNNELNFDSFYEITNGVIYFPGTKAEIEFNIGYVDRIDLGNIVLPDGYNLSEVNFKNLTPAEAKTLVQIVLLNGFQVQWPFRGDPPGSIQKIFRYDSPFVEKLNELQVPDGVILPIPILEETSLGGDAILWLMDTLTPFTPLTDLIEGRLKSIFANQTDLFVPLAYSGSGQALLRALDRLSTVPGNGVETAILVGAPLYDTHMDNSSTALKRIVNIYGTADLGIYELDIPIPQGIPIVSNIPVVDGKIKSPTIAKEITSSFGLQTINIELVGVAHDMYFLSPDNVQSDPDKAILNNRANDFVALMSEAALRGGSKLEDELINIATEIKTDPNKPLVKTYVVDLRD